MPILTQHKIKVQVVAPAGKVIPVLDWDSSDGGKLTHSVSKVRRSAGGPKEVLSGDSEVDNITTTAFIDAAAHSDFLVALRNGEKFEGATIQLVFIDNAGVQVGSPLKYTMCSVAGFTPPKADANGEEAAKLEIEWAVGN